MGFAVAKGLVRVVVCDGNPILPPSLYSHPCSGGVTFSVGVISTNHRCIHWSPSAGGGSDKALRCASLYVKAEPGNWWSLWNHAPGRAGHWSLDPRLGQVPSCFCIRARGTVAAEPLPKNGRMRWLSKGHAKCIVPAMCCPADIAEAGL